MSDRNDHSQTSDIHVATEDARAGATPHVTRYVLGISLALIVLIFAWLFIR